MDCSRLYGDYNPKDARELEATVMSRTSTVSCPVQPLTAYKWASSQSTNAQPPSATLTGLDDPCRRVWSSDRKISLCIEGVSAPAWLERTLERLNHLLTLPPNWDSYGGKCIYLDDVLRALRLLAAVMGDRTPPPQIVPTSKGGVQLEWHEQGIDLEIEVATGSSVLASFEDSMTGTMWERTIGPDTSALAGALEILAARGASR
jgi:hypothetical protein